MARRRPSSLPAPYLRRLWLDVSSVTAPKAYPFCLPFLRDFCIDPAGFVDERLRDE